VLVADLSRTPQPGNPQPGSAQPGAAQPGDAQPAPTPPTGEQPAPVLSALSAVTGAVDGTKPRPEPLDPPMVPFALAGLGAFVLAGLVGLVFRGWLADHGHTDWLWICVAGFGIGLPGLATMMRHDRHRRARRALTHPEVRQL
jgi:hypothetical protein